MDTLFVDFASPRNIPWRPSITTIVPANFEFSAFHNWCDRCCEQCPLQRGCPVPRSTDTLEEVFTNIGSTLEQACAEHGISLEHLPSPPPPGIDASLLRDTATELAAALFGLGLSGPGLVLAGKVVRVASYLDDEDGDRAWQADAVPNLLLVEKLLAEIDTAGPLPERIERINRRLRGLLAPLIATIPEQARRMLGALVAARCAPSPFVRVGPGETVADRSQPS